MTSQQLANTLIHWPACIYLSLWFTGMAIAPWLAGGL